MACWNNAQFESECCVRKSFRKTIYFRINVLIANAVRLVMASHLFARSLFISIDFATVQMQNGWLSASLTFLVSKVVPLFPISSSSLRTIFPCLRTMVYCTISKLSELWFVCCWGIERTKLPQSIHFTIYHRMETENVKNQRQWRTFLRIWRGRDAMRCLYSVDLYSVQTLSMHCITMKNADFVFA